MRNNLLLQLLIFVGLFVGSWQLIARADWVTLLQLERAGDQLEETLGELVWEALQRTNEEITEPEIVQPLDSILTRICKANQIDRATIKLHVVKSEQVNAFTLPDGHIAVFTGLITECQNAEELAGVIGHELAHMQLNHVMKKLVGELGFAVLVSMTTGGRGGEVAGELMRVISSTAYGRKLETEADRKGVEYLLRARINPAPLADFMYRIADMANMPSGLAWLSTHPDSKERANAIVEQIAGENVKFKPALSESAWETLQDSVR